jgi:hypothetical protein
VRLVRVREGVSILEAVEYSARGAGSLPYERIGSRELVFIEECRCVDLPVTLLLAY